MYGQAHAGIGWVIGVAAPGSDRRLRIWCVAASLLPDADALILLVRKEYFDRFHHTFVHNVFAGILGAAAAAWHFRRYPRGRRLLAVALVVFCFALHVLGDMKFSGWEVCPFWPLSYRAYDLEPNLDLGHPVNFALAYGFMIVPWLLAFWKKVTPLEILSPRLDRMFVNFFRRRDLECGACGRRCNDRCDGCGRPVCMRHGRIGWRFRLRCPACSGGGPGREGSPR